MAHWVPDVVHLDSELGIGAEKVYLTRHFIPRLVISREATILAAD